MLTSKWNTLKRFLVGLEQQFGQGLLQSAPESPLPAVWSSGSWGLDQALGVGGYPKGRMIEIFGDAGVGKSTLALHAIQSCQQAGGLAVYIDAEHGLDLCYAGVLGVRLNDLLIVKPSSAEQALGTIETLVQSRQVGMIVLDSIAALAPQIEIDTQGQTEQIFLQAQLLSRTLRRLSSLLHHTPTTLLFLNQLRYHPQAAQVLRETTPGGHALKFYASIRLELVHKGHLLQNDRILGQHILARVLKNKSAPPYQEAHLTIRYGEGIDSCADLLQRAILHGIVQRDEHKHLCFPNGMLGPNYDAALHALRRSLPLQEQLTTLVTAVPPHLQHEPAA
ncbi:DNA recombination/repair protein RecA [Myxococcota bacterium]|nr:DNA recombination/repair protein RecA [Myxococcota bacterium]